MNVADAPEASVAIVSVIVLPLLLRVNVGPLVCVCVPMVSDAGSVSLSVTPAASVGPRLVTVIVKLTLPPTIEVADDDVTVTLRSEFAADVLIEIFWLASPSVPVAGNVKTAGFNAASWIVPPFNVSDEVEA